MTRQWVPCCDWRRLQRWGILLFGTVWLTAFVSSGSANALVGPTVAQMSQVAAQISIIQAELAVLGTSPSVTAGISLGTAAGNAMLAVAANDGGYAASLQTLTPYVPSNEGNPGVY